MGGKETGSQRREVCEAVRLDLRWALRAVESVRRTRPPFSISRGSPGPFSGERGGGAQGLPVGKARGRGMGVCFDSKGLVMGSKSAHLKKFPHSREAA